MNQKRYTLEFKEEAVRQVTQRGYSVKEVAERLGVSTHSLYKWIRAARPQTEESDKLAAADREMRALRAELRRTQEERDIPKKSRRVLCQGARVKYAFIRRHRHEHRVVVMCRVLRVHRSGYYAWLRQPLSDRAVENRRLLALIRTSYEASGCSYGSPRVFLDLREEGESCGLNRVARLMRRYRIKAVRSYRRPRYVAGKPSVVAPDRLEREFTVPEPNRAWVTDITYIRTWQGWLYLAAVMDLFSRKIVGWSIQSTLARSLVLDAILMAVWRRKPGRGLLIHSDQGSQYGSDDWHRFCKAHGLTPSMSRRGNCWDNAVAESFFSSLKKERVRRKIYRTKEEAKADLFDYIEMFYNPRRRHSHIGGVSPEVFERASSKDLVVSTKLG
ncbi:MAG: IS3 family transposase [Candidatus Eisenbacteria bacterium]